MSASKGPELPLVLVKWYDYAKWVLERVENFPKSQRFVLGQRLSNQVMEVLEILVEATYSREKRDLLGTANRKNTNVLNESAFRVMPWIRLPADGHWFIGWRPIPRVANFGLIPKGRWYYQSL